MDSPTLAFHQKRTTNHDHMEGFCSMRAIEVDFPKRWVLSSQPEILNIWKRKQKIWKFTGKFPEYRKIVGFLNTRHRKKTRGQKSNATKMPSTKNPNICRYPARFVLFSEIAFCAVFKFFFEWKAPAVYTSMLNRFTVISSKTPRMGCL